MDILKNWITLLKHIEALSEKSCLELLEKEKAGQKRVAFLLRIYGRMNKQRTQRERAALRKLANEHTKSSNNRL